MGEREKVYDEEIAPLMTQIIAIAKRMEIPMFATFQYTEPEEEAGFCTTMIPGTGEARALSVLKARWNHERLGVALAITEVSGPEGTTISVRRVT